MTKITCPSCKRRFSRISNHWRYHEDHIPELSDRKRNIITGWVMGDASVGSKEREKPYVIFYNSNVNFLEWTSENIGFMTKGDLSVNNKENEMSDNDSYKMLSVSHPFMSKFSSWYESGTKLFIEDVTFDRLTTKIWYCCDGGLSWAEGNRAKSCIYSINDSRNLKVLSRIFEQKGFDNWIDDKSINFGRESTGELLEWMGDPPDGMGYKWQNKNRKVYKKMKEKAIGGHKIEKQSNISKWVKGQ